MPRYKPVKTVCNKYQTVPTRLSGSTAKKADNPDLKNLGMRVLGTYRKNEEWLVDIRFGKRKPIRTGKLFIDFKNRKPFLIFESFFGTQIEVFLE